MLPAIRRHAPAFTTALTVTLSALILAACGTTPSGTPSGPSQPTREQFHADIGNGFSVDYQIERKQSENHGRACYAFITATLNNQSGMALSRQSVVDITVFSQGKQLFRDLTNPVSDVPPGSRIMLRMVDSPVHRDGCPVYDNIRIQLRPVRAG